MKGIQIGVSGNDKRQIYRVAADLVLKGLSVTPGWGLNAQTFKATINRLIKEKDNKELAASRTKLLNDYRAQFVQLVQNNPELIADSDTTDPDSVAATLIKDLLKNLDREKNGHRYEEVLLKVSFIISVYSHPALETLHQCLNFPCIDTVMRHYGELVDEFKNALTHIENLPDLMHHAGLTEGSRITLAIDAVNLKLHYSEEQTQNAKKSNAFLFLSMPLDDDSRNVIIHAYENESGLISKNNSNDIFNTIDMIKKKFKVSYVAHDGDQGYDSHDIATLATWDKKVSFDEMVSILSDFIVNYKGTLYVIDMLHFAKNRRTALILRPLTVTPYYIVSPSIERIREVIPLGDALDDVEGLGKMQDTYPIALFSILTLKALCEKDYFAEIVFITPIAFWIEAVRNEYLTKESRLQLLKIAFLFEYNFLQGCDAMGDGITTNDRGRSSDHYFISSKIAMIQACNTILIHYVELLHNDHLNFSHLSTMTLEHINGQIRNGCNGNDTFDMLVAFLSKYNVAMNMMKEIGVNFHKKGRDFQGGITYDATKCTTPIMLPEDVDESVIVDSLLSKCCWNAYFTVGAIDVFYDYIDRLSTVAAKIKIPKHLECQLKGRRIFSRLCQKTK